MTILPHALGGAVSATLTDNYFLAFLFGFISHFILDMLPHLEPKFLVKVEPDKTKKWSIWLFVFVIVEFCLTILLFLSFIHRSDFAILLVGALGGLIPDMIVNNPFLQKFRYKPVIKHLFAFHDKIHLDLPSRYWFVSLIVEGSLIGGSIWYLLKY